MKRLPNALLATTALVAVVCLNQPAWGVGGAGGGGATGGADSATATGSAGGAGSSTNGGGGGGAGATGGAGGAAGAGAGGGGGGSAGAAGAAGLDGSGVGASGGGGGAHGAVGAGLPGASVTGGNGGQGGHGSAGGSGGGGGAGGWGAVVTGNPGTVTLNATVTGGNGGDGGTGAGGGQNGAAGTGGTGLHFGSAVTSVTINAAVTGGNGGNATSPAAAGAGGVGIALSTNLTTSLVIGAAVSGGSAGNGGAQAFALSTGTAGAHSLTMAAGGSLSGGINIGTGSSLTFVQNADVTISSVISGGGALNKEGTGRLTLTAASTYSGTTTIFAGAISLAADAALGQASAALRLAGDGQLITTASFTSARNITLGNTSGGVIAPAQGTVLTLTGTISQGGSPTSGLTVAGLGTLILTGAGTQSRTAINTGATLQIGAGGTTGSVGNGAITNNGTLILNRSDAVTMSNAISGTGGLTQAGTGTTTLGGALTYTGETRVDAGTLAFTHAGLFAGGTSRFTVASGATLNLTGLSGVLAASSINGGGAVQLPTTGRLSLTGDSNFSGVISGGSSLLLTGGTTILTGSNSFTGGTTIQGGATLRLGDGGTTGSVPGAIENNGTLAFNRSDSVSMAGAISGTGQLIQNGTGTLTLTGANSYSGTTTVAAGTLRIGDGAASGTLGSGAVVNNGSLVFVRPDAITIANGMTGSGALSLASGTVTATGALSHGGGTSIASGARLNIGQGGTSGSLAGNVVNNGTLGFARSDSVTFAGTISGTGGLQQNGTGNLILTGANTYTGPTVVNAGTLSVNGSLSGASAITVASGATLGGTGQLGAVTVPVGGTMAPGNSIGTMQVAALTLAAGSTTAIEVQGSTIDRINVTGNATLGGTLRLLPLGGTYSFNTPYTIIQADSITGNFATVTTSGSFGAGITPMVSVEANQLRLGLAPAILVPAAQPPPPPPPPSPLALALPEPGAAPPPDSPPPPAPPAPGIPGFLTHNLRATAGALDAANRAGADLNRFFAVYNQPASTIGLAVNQLAGEVATSTGAMGFAAGEQLLATVLDPPGPGRGGMMGGRLRPSGGEGEANRKRYAVWGSATGAYNRTTGDAQDGSASRTTRTSGFVLGFDHRIGAQGMAGVAVAVGESSASLASGQGHATANFGQVAAYASTRLGSFTVAGAGAVTVMDVDTSRRLYFLDQDQQRAGFNAQVYSLRAKARQDGVTAGGLRFQPLAAIQWQQVNNAGYTEISRLSGSATGLSVGGQSQTSLRTELGGQVDGAAMIGGVPVQGFLRAAWAYYLTRDAAMAVGFASLPNAGFTVRGARADASAALVSAGLEVPIRPGLALGARIDSELSGNVTQVAGTARLRYAF